MCICECMNASEKLFICATQIRIVLYNMLPRDKELCDIILQRRTCLTYIFIIYTGYTHTYVVHTYNDNMQRVWLKIKMKKYEKCMTTEWQKRSVYVYVLLPAGNGTIELIDYVLMHSILYFRYGLLRPYMYVMG